MNYVYHSLFFAAGLAIALVAARFIVDPYTMAIVAFFIGLTTMFLILVREFRVLLRRRRK